MSGVEELTAAIAILKGAYDAIHIAYNIVEDAQQEPRYIDGVGEIVYRLSLSLAALRSCIPRYAISPETNEYMKTTSQHICIKSTQIKNYLEEYKKRSCIRKLLRSMFTRKKPAEDDVDALCKMVYEMQRMVTPQLQLGIMTGQPLSQDLADWEKYYDLDFDSDVLLLQNMLHQARRKFEVDLRKGKCDEYLLRYIRDPSEYWDTIQNYTVIWKYLMDTSAPGETEFILKKITRLQNKFLKPFCDLCEQIYNQGDLTEEEFTQKLVVEFSYYKIERALELSLSISRYLILYNATHAGCAPHHGIVWIQESDSMTLRSKGLSPQASINSPEADQCCNEVQKYFQPPFGTIGHYHTALMKLFGLEDNIGCWLYPDIPDHYVTPNFDKSKFETALYGAGIVRQGRSNTRMMLQRTTADLLQKNELQNKIKELQREVRGLRRDRHEFQRAQPELPSENQLPDAYVLSSSNLQSKNKTLDQPCPENESN